MNAKLKALHARGSVEWGTPKAVFDVLHAEFGFDFDPCPLGGSIDGTARLLNPWTGRRVFCNPPYGPDLRKFLELWREAELAVYLIPARTDTRWFHEICLPFAKEIRFIKGRLKFGDSKNSAPFPSMVVIFENELGRSLPRSDDWMRLLGWQDQLKEQAHEAGVKS